MLSSYGFDTPFGRFNASNMIPEYIAEVLKEYQAIVGVQIDYTGYLVGKGIPHWVVLDRVQVMNNRAIVDIYNPYTNSIEPYSWRELMTSTGAYKQGLWIER